MIYILWLVRKAKGKQKKPFPNVIFKKCFYLMMNFYVSQKRLPRIWISELLKRKNQILLERKQYHGESFNNSCETEFIEFIERESIKF